MLVYTFWGNFNFVVLPHNSVSLFLFAFRLGFNDKTYCLESKYVNSLVVAFCYAVTVTLIQFYVF